MNSPALANARIAPSPSPVPSDAPKCPILADAPDAKDLTATQVKAIELLIRGHRVSEVVEALAVDRKTLYRWRKECEPFRAELRERQRHLMDDAIRRVRALLRPSIEVLESNLEDEPGESAAIRAANTVLRLVTTRGGPFALAANSEDD
jgi:hypothetical protein